MAPRPLLVVIILGPLALACATDPGGGDETAAETAETGGQADDEHGSVRIEVSPLNGDLTILDGTTEVIATVNYEACLQDFYLNRQPTYQQDGPDGAPVFADWIGRLCSDFSDITDCEITEIGQSLIEATDVYTLGVAMTINDASTLAYREIHVGPLPVEALASCAAGQQPSVELRPSGLIGRDAGGNQIWRISTLPAQNTAVVDQGAPLRVEVIAN